MKIKCNIKFSERIKKDGRKIWLIFFASFLLSFSNFLFAEKTPLKNVHRYKLENGLSVFVIEDHLAPLAYIEIAVKAGGIAQSAETAGLFHLYEHMMFKGNEKYSDAARVQKALSDLGVTEWNGTTGAECVNYFFTVPSKLLFEGMEFWSYAIRSPLIDEQELENEKKVVLSEIEGSLSDPNTVYRYGVQNHLFPKYPWRCDPSGNPRVVKNATVEDIKAIQKKYYVPNNAALFVAGDVVPERVFEYAKTLYGTWERSANPWEKSRGAQLENPLYLPTFCVMPYEQISPGIAQVSVIYRGPDAGYDEKATYAADMLGYFFDDPQNIYVQTILKNLELGIPDADYVWESYLTTRETSTLSFGSLIVGPENNLVSRSILFYNTLTNEIIPSVINNKNIFSKKQFKRVYQKIKDSFIEDAELASRLKTNLRFWWICSSDEYYYNYVKNMMSVRKKDIDKFLKDYITNKNALITVLVHPSVYESQKKEFEQAGFSVINSRNAFWYNSVEDSSAGDEK